MDKKVFRIKARKFPKSALAFYIKVYFKQKGSAGTKLNLIEAMKSWLSLSESEKLQIHTKYRESEHQFKLQCLNRLKQAEPFMKIKKPVGLTNYENDSLTLEHKVDCEIGPQKSSYHAINEIADGVTSDCDEELLVADNVDSAELPMLCQEEQMSDYLEEPVDTNEQTCRTFLVEPLPPSLKTGKDLYHMLNSTVTSVTTWSALSKIERNQYSRAVLLLKKDYIIKYKEYLESLPPVELFNYYNKTFFI